MNFHLKHSLGVENIGCRGELMQFGVLTSITLIHPYRNFMTDAQ